MILADDVLRARLTTALDVPRFVREVLRAAPFEDLDALLAAAHRAARLTPAEVDAALAHHPRIGERPAGDGAAAAHSRREQASADADDAALAAAIARGNREYETRFGRIFLIRAAGRTRQEILAELHRRIVLDDEMELAEVGQQLREIALLRLRTMYEEDA